MKHSKFVEEIKKPLVYGSLVDSVEMIQTHISFVVLAGDYAYKIKKPVDFGFLDFSTLDKRKHFCEEEIRLNSRLCPDIYLEVITFTETDDGMLELDGGGKIVE
ncbi:MAG: AAA family ATPase, partial [Candidatus Thermoplasmatota archaeon]|nr:AAA family ATPase [Candidatus Thermoplasmatota archaeon]